MGSLVSRRHLRIAVLPLFLFAATAAGQAGDRDTPVAVKRTVSTSGRIGNGHGRLPLVFVANDGRSDPRVRFLSRGPGYALFLTEDAAVLKLNPPAGNGQADVIRLRLGGAQPPASIVGENIQGETVPRSAGAHPTRWHRETTTFGKVRYRSVYPGVDAVYYSNQQKLEFDLELRPGIDPAVIRLRFDGARAMRIDGQGNLVLSAAGGDIRQPKPFVYQVVAGERRAVPARYVMKGKGEIGFAIGPHIRALPLVIQ